MEKFMPVAGLRGPYHIYTSHEAIKLKLAHPQNKFIGFMLSNQFTKSNFM